MTTTAASFTAHAQRPQYVLPILDRLPPSSSEDEAADLTAYLSLYLTVYITLLEAANNQDWQTLQPQLANFKRLLASQLTESYRELLKFRKTGYNGDDDLRDRYHFHTDLIDTIGPLLPLLNRYDGNGSASPLPERYTCTPLDHETLALFIADLEQIGERLMAKVS